MKIIKVVTILTFACVILSIAALLFGLSVVPICTLVIAAGLLAADFSLIRREAGIQEFLIAESKKEKKRVIWDDDERERLELMRQKAELSSLQYQINPHFLYNTLDTIRGQALLNGQTDIAQMTEKLSRYFRYSISRRENIVKVEEELNHIQDYFFIQKKRFSNRFDMYVKLEEEELKDYYMPKMILQPLLENAISHGLEKVNRKGEVHIFILKTDKKLIIRMADNGVGMSEDKLLEINERMREGRIQLPTKSGRHNGIAIQNVNSRIRMMFGDDYGIHYHSEKDYGTVAIVTIPLVDAFTRAKYEECI